MSDRVLFLLEPSFRIGLPMLASDEFLINPSASVFTSIDASDPRSTLSSCHRSVMFHLGPRYPIWARSTLLGVGSNVVGPIQISTMDRYIELGLLDSLGQF